MDMTPVVYFTNPVDPENNFNVETSIIKLHTETLECAEIYKSKFKVIHLSMKEIKEKTDQVEIPANKNNRKNADSHILDSDENSDLDNSDERKEKQAAAQRKKQVY